MNQIGAIASESGAARAPGNQRNAESSSNNLLAIERVETFESPCSALSLLAAPPRPRGRAKRPPALPARAVKLAPTVTTMLQERSPAGQVHQHAHFGDIDAQAQIDGAAILLAEKPSAISVVRELAFGRLRGLLAHTDAPHTVGNQPKRGTRQGSPPIFDAAQFPAAPRADKRDD